jgi:hypothetical protein
MRQFEQDWLQLGRRVACSLYYQHPRNLRLLQAAQAELAVGDDHQDDVELQPVARAESPGQGEDNSP